MIYRIFFLAVILQVMAAMAHIAGCMVCVMSRVSRPPWNPRCPHSLDGLRDDDNDGR